MFKPKSMDEAYVQTWYLENIGMEKGKSSGFKQKEKHDAFKEGKKKWKGGNTKKKMAATAH